MARKIVIDFTQKRLDESWITNFAGDVASILAALGQNTAIPVSVKGSTSDIRSFAKLLGAEKKYMNAYEKFGLNNPSTYRTKTSLERAIANFERQTGVIYPLR